MEDQNIKIAVLQSQMNNLEKKVDEGFLVNEKRFDVIEKMMKEFIDTSDGRYASKLVEKVVWSAMGVVGGALLLAALSKLIIK